MLASLAMSMAAIQVPVETGRGGEMSPWIKSSLSWRGGGGGGWQERGGKGTKEGARMERDEREVGGQGRRG